MQEGFEPFFAALHEGLKNLHKIVRGYEKTSREANGARGAQKNMKAIKEALEKLETEVKEAEAFFGYVRWLQERFPKAEYEDVTGLCKLANMKDLEEQDFSLNPGRYVGVVIEDDGRTEEEFIDEMLEIQSELERLSKDARELEKVIGHNFKQITGEE